MYLSACVFFTCLLGIPEARRGHWIHWSWSYRRLWATTWVLGTEPSSSGRAASAINLWSSSQLQTKFFVFSHPIRHYVDNVKGYSRESLWHHIMSYLPLAAKFHETFSFPINHQIGDHLTLYKCLYANIVDIFNSLCNYNIFTYYLWHEGSFLVHLWGPCCV